MDTNSQPFSARENEVIALLLQGKSNKQMALELDISVRTVEFHLKNIYKKLQVTSRAEAILHLGKTTASGSTTLEPVVTRVDGEPSVGENGKNIFAIRRISMKYVFYIIFGGLLLIGLVTILALGWLFPLSRASSATATAVPDTQITFDGTSLNIPAALGGRTSNEVIQPQDSYAQLWPSHTRFILGNYPLTDTVYQPQIQVFLTQDYAQMSPDAAAIIDDLRTALQSRAWSATDPLPYLPFTRTAAQAFHTQEKFLRFINGSGLRYLTLYSQAAFPVEKLSHLELLYTYQGLSETGKYYVSVTMPIRLDYVTVSEIDASPFPEDGIPFNWDNPDPAQYPEYLAKVVTMLGHENNPFNPSLEMLDALVQSIAVGVEQ